MEHKRVKRLDREHKWMEQTDFSHIKQQIGGRIVCQNVHSESVYYKK